MSAKGTKAARRTAVRMQYRRCAPVKQVSDVAAHVSVHTYTCNEAASRGMNPTVVDREATPRSNCRTWTHMGTPHKRAITHTNTRSHN